VTNLRGAAEKGRGIVRVLAVALALLAVGTTASATDETASATDEKTSAAGEKASTWAEGLLAEKPSQWAFEAEPYGWLFGNYGSVDVKGHAVTFAVSPSDVYGLLEDGKAFAGSGYFSLAYGRWSAFVDSSGGYARESVHETIPTQLCTLSVRAQDKVKYVITDAAFGYQLGEWTMPGRTRPLTLGVYAGMRYMFFSNRLSATAGVVHGTQQSGTSLESFQWADPLIGIRWSVPLLDSVALTLRADIGGFDASSHLIWGLVGDVRYWVPWSPFGVHPYLAVGYRDVAFERASSPGSIQLQFRGPLSGLGFAF
jgi:hypothetical protein